VIKDMAYDDQNTKANIIVNLIFSGKDQISNLSASLIDSRTQLTVRTFDQLPVSSPLTLTLQDLPGIEYTVSVVTYGQDGNITNTSTGKFVHTIVPTNTPTFTPSFTPVVHTAVLGVPRVDNGNLIFTITTTNPEVFANYRVQVINQTSNLVQQTY